MLHRFSLDQIWVFLMTNNQKLRVRLTTQYCAAVYFRWNINVDGQWIQSTVCQPLVLACPSTQFTLQIQLFLALRVYLFQDGSHTGAFLQFSLSPALSLTSSLSFRNPLTHALDPTGSSLSLSLSLSFSLSFLLSLSRFFTVERYPKPPEFAQNNHGHFLKTSHRTHNCDRTEQPRRQNCPCRGGTSIINFREPCFYREMECS